MSNTRHLLKLYKAWFSLEALVLLDIVGPYIFHDIGTALEICLAILQSLPLKSPLLSFQFMTISFFHMIDKVKTNLVKIVKFDQNCEI